MTILLNDIPIKLPCNTMTVADLVKWKQIPSQGTAIAINDKLIKQDQWSVKRLEEMNQVTVISAAFGG